MNRQVVRSLVFVVAAALAGQVLPWREAAAFAALSPLLGLLGALAARTATGWTWLGVPVLALAFFRSRWFCRQVCPVGWAAEAVGRRNRRARGRFAKFPRIGRWLVPIMLGGAIMGHPLFLWLDPLAIFNGFWSAWRVPLTAASLALAAGFPLVLLLSLRVPQVWCHRICPLGALQDYLVALRRALRLRPAPAGVPAPGLELGRRTFLGALAGGVAAVALRRFGPAGTLPVRPPGARPEAEFAGLCARCGACVRACAYRILRPALGSGGVAGLLTPVVDYSAAHCFEYCNECAKVCPSGAIARLTLDAKRNRAIGLAEIDRAKCIAWNDRQYCMVCHEFCPYLAIDSVEHHGVHCPVVKPDMCRGCGACQVNCPALPAKAIVVRGIPQRAARPLAEVS